MATLEEPGNLFISLLSIFQAYGYTSHPLAPLAQKMRQCTLGLRSPIYVGWDSGLFSAFLCRVFTVLASILAQFFSYSS